MSNPKLAIIDDNVEITRFIEIVGNQLGYTVVVAADISSANFNEYLPNFADAEIIILDIVMPEVDGIEILQALAKDNCRAKIVLMSGYGAAYLNYAKQLGSAAGLDVTATLKKPIKLKTLNNILNWG